MIKKYVCILILACLLILMSAGCSDKNPDYSVFTVTNGEFTVQYGMTREAVEKQLWRG